MTTTLLAAKMTFLQMSNNATLLITIDRKQMRTLATQTTNTKIMRAQ